MVHGESIFDSGKAEQSSLRFSRPDTQRTQTYPRLSLKTHARSVDFQHP
jgi:hypothetical protein